ncbi:MarR family winged helix-turn-helix transcriptional regulator [Microbacterium sp. RD1]|uniref:MarR family winged helix-turn-helix transcriptional regulator n=1 Tax=Microbacterium sp. RD1 TaxID=3457313 RepID=UPI003FA5565A
MAKTLRIDPIAEARRQWLAHGWDAAADGMTAVISVNRAQQLLMARIDAALRPLDLTFARYELLRMLAFTAEGRMPLSSAVARLQVHATSVTNTVDRLVRDDLLVRAPHPTDRRAALLLLTDAGRARAEEATTALNEVFSALGMDSDDEIELARIIARFRKRSGDFEEPSPVPDPI